ncbi:MAG: autotransporter assembly complex protein TamA, partial [Gammaproteobacteria bacterium]
RAGVTATASAGGGEGECWRAQVRISAGERVRWRAVRVKVEGEGAADAAFEAIRSDPGITPGEPLVHGAYEALRERLSSAAAQRGYLEARFLTRQLRVDPAEGWADAVLSLDSGPRYRVGDITVSGGEVGEDLVLRTAGLKPGQPYLGPDLATAYRRLRGSGQFASVDIVPRLAPNAARVVPISIRLTSVPKRVWRFGAGFDTNTGPRVSAGLTRRRINSRGHQFDIEARVARELTELHAEYRIPGGDPVNERWSVDLGLRHESSGDVVSDQVATGVHQLIQPGYAWLPGTLTEQRSLTLLSEDSSTGDTRQSSLLLMPSIDWVWQPPVPVQDLALSLRAGAKGASTAAVSDVDFLQFEAGVDGRYPLGADWTLLGRLDLATSLVSDFEQLPASQRLFAGGDNSIRGYGFKKVGPLDSTGAVVGGRHLAVGSVEIERRLTEQWGVAAFVDAGDAFNDGSVELLYGYGLGARWNSPIGKVKLDFAIPSDRSRDDWRLHFSLGARF